MENKIRMHYRFTGIVQGVGFRWTANNLASALGLTGFVYNDWDGSVQMEVQGRKETIQKMIERLDSEIFIQIEGIEKNELPVITSEISFHVKD